MNHSPRSFWARAAWAGAAAGLFLVLTGDRGAFGAATGIDPLEILKLQVKPNVLIILDSSGSMEEPFTNTPSCCPSIGGDFAFSKMAKAKVALNRVLKANQGVINFGFATYFTQNTNKRIMNSAGAMRYVTDQTTADLWTGGTTGPDNTTDYFRAGSTPYTGTNGADVFRSFDTETLLLDEVNAAACTVEPCQRFLNSRMVRNNVRFTWNTTGAKPATAADALLTATTPIDCSLPANHAPLALFPDDPDLNGDGLSDTVRPCFQMQDSAGNVTTFWWSSANWNESGTSNCSGAALLSAVAACGTDSVPTILQKVKPELPLDGTCGATPLGMPCATTVNTVVENTNPAGASANAWEGVIAAGSTPLGGALNYVNTNFTTVFPSAIGGSQQNFVILVTDGIETCGGNPVTAACNLYAHNPRVYTFVIGLAINTGTLDQIARCGSGGSRDAIPAANVDELEAALNSVLDTAISTGAFSASQNVVSTVYELVKDLPTTPEHESPYDPDTRYNQRVNILYQSTFGLPGWEGHLYAFQNDGTFLPVTGVNYSGNFDAGETLFEQVSQVLEVSNRGSGRQDNRYTFFELHNGANVNSVINEDPASGGALIRRRIFTSNGNGTFPRTGAVDDQFDSSTTAGRNVVAVWPPDQTGLSSGIAPIDPAVGTVGPLDDALGIGPGSATVLTYTDLQTKFGACVGSTDPDSGTIPPGCNPAADPVLALDTARKEARHILLAWIAGARLDKGTSDAKPRRAQDGGNDGELIFRDRGWLLLDSANASPAVLSPQLGADPPFHVAEWVLLRDGRRSAAGLGIQEFDKGFGLTNPDRDDPNPTGLTDLKPVMTVIYAAHNDGLHAFSALTSEELWNFIPYDQLGKIANMISPGQSRVPHIYMMATSVRSAEVFLPDVDGFTLPSPSGTPVSYSGRWRTILFLGRGPGGKFYTALDVTAPGQFTRAVLATNPPFVMWSRGNPDSADPTRYARMGQTWSIPAVGDVSGSADDYRVFTGSGYGDLPGEGTTFYQLDPATGNVLVANDVGAGSGTFIPDNALVAPPAGYNTFSLDPPYTLVRSQPNEVSRVYIPDLHGRIWKFGTTSGALFYDAGVNQPFANGPALLKLGDVPNVFIESGNDNRIPADSARPFKMFGLLDGGSDTPATNDGSLLFAIDFPATAPSNIQFRGTSRPVTAYTSDGKGVVFFVGTRFNTATADCISSFDTVVFGVVPDGSAAAGYTAGYDFNGDGTRDISTVITGQRASGATIAGGTLNLSMGGTLSASPPPCGGAGCAFPGPQNTPTPPQPSPPAVPVTKISSTSPVCRF